MWLGDWKQTQIRPRQNIFPWSLFHMTSLVKESLAIILDSSLSMEPVPRDLFGKKKSFFLLQHLSKISHCLSTDATTKLVVYLSISHLDYCNFLFVDLPVATFHALQSLQNTGAPGARPFMSPPSPTFSLDCLPITNHISLKLNCLAIKASITGSWLLIFLASCAWFHPAHFIQQQKHTGFTLSALCLVANKPWHLLIPLLGTLNPLHFTMMLFWGVSSGYLKFTALKLSIALNCFMGSVRFANPIYTLT